MAITTEFLNGLGISADVASAIFKERGIEINEANSKISELTEQNNKLNESIKTLISEKESLSKLAGDAETYKKKYEEFEAENKARIEREQAAVADKELTDKILAVFGDKKFTSDYVKDGLIADIKKIHAADTTKGLSEIFTELTKDKEGIFKSSHDKLNLSDSSDGGKVDNSSLDAIRAAFGLKTESTK